MTIIILKLRSEAVRRAKVGVARKGPNLNGVLQVWKNSILLLLHLVFCAIHYLMSILKILLAHPLTQIIRVHNSSLLNFWLSTVIGCIGGYVSRTSQVPKNCFATSAGVVGHACEMSQWKRGFTMHVVTLKILIWWIVVLIG